MRRPQRHVRGSPQRAVCPAAFAASGPEQAASGSLSERSDKDAIPSPLVWPRSGAGRCVARSLRPPPFPLTALRAQLRVPGGCLRRGGKLLLIAWARCSVAAATKFAPKVLPRVYPRAPRPPGLQPRSPVPTFRAGRSPAAPSRWESPTGKSLRREGREREAGGFRTR